MAIQTGTTLVTQNNLVFTKLHDFSQKAIQKDSFFCYIIICHFCVGERL